MSDPRTTGIDAARVRRIAELARLELSEEEVARMTGELARIVAYVGQLEELALDGVPPTAHAVSELPLRDDEPAPSLDPEVVLREAPRAVDGAFAVPTFVDES